MHMPDPWSDSSAPSRPASAPAVAPDAREHIVAQLTEHFAQDRLSLEEFESRTTAVYEAATPEDLARVTTGLPQQPYASSLVPSLPVRLEAVLGNLTRGGPLAVPAHLHVRAAAGNIKLDLRQAHFEPGVTEIEVYTLFCNIEVQLPSYVHVENHGSRALSSFSYQHGSGDADPVSRDASVHVVRFTGRTVLSNITVKRL